MTVTKNIHIPSKHETFVPIGPIVSILRLQAPDVRGVQRFVFLGLNAQGDTAAIEVFEIPNGEALSVPTWVRDFEYEDYSVLPARKARRYLSFKTTGGEYQRLKEQQFGYQIWGRYKDGLVGRYARDLRP